MLARAIAQREPVDAWVERDRRDSKVVTASNKKLKRAYPVGKCVRFEDVPLAISWLGPATELFVQSCEVTTLVK